MPPRAYAADTYVSVTKSKGEIEALLQLHGATKFNSGWTETHDILQFHLFDQTIRFTLPRPNLNDPKFAKDRRGRTRPNAVRDKAFEQANRQRWRALYLVIRAKLEAIQAGIAVYQQEFLAFIVDPVTNLTVGDVLIPRIEAGKGVPRLEGDVDVQYRRTGWRCPCGELNPFARVDCGNCGASPMAATGGRE